MSNVLTVYDKNVLHNEAIKTAKMILKTFMYSAAIHLFQQSNNGLRIKRDGQVKAF